MSFASDEEHDLFENSFFYYVKALLILSHNADTQCEEMGNYNTPWEIQADVGTSGIYLIRPAASYLTWEQTEKIVELSAALKALPREAIAPIGMLMTSHAGCLYAMNHPAWEPLRERAKELLVLLESAIKRNQAYFSGD
jgi:hypothetical protein